MQHTFSLCFIFLWCFVKFASVVCELLLKHDFDLWPDCDLDLGRRNINLVYNTPSHYTLYFCIVPLNLLQQFMSYCLDRICNGLTDRQKDGRTDGVILICLPKFLRGHKNWNRYRDDNITPILSVWPNFLTLKGTLLRGEWSDSARNRTWPRFYACSRYLQEWRRPEKKLKSLSWWQHFPNVESMGKFSNGQGHVTPEWTTRFSPKSNLTEILCPSSVTARMKAIRKKILSHVKSMGAMCCYGNQSSTPISLKTLCSISSYLMMLHVTIDQDWPTGCRDILCWK